MAKRQRKSSRRAGRPAPKRKAASKRRPKAALVRARARKPLKARARVSRPRRRRPERARPAPGIERERRRLPESEDLSVPTPPSTLDRGGFRTALRRPTDAITGGDVDADWQLARDSGEEAPGGDNPTPDQDRVDDLGRALGVEYQDNEPLKSSDKISERDRHRWELDPASSEDYRGRRKRGE